MLNYNHNILDIKKILKILPHRYPLLLIDRILDFKIFCYVKALKNCTINEPFFQGHFLKKPIFPGVLIIESMTQAAAILIYKSTGILNINKLYYFVGIENARFKKNVIPGDQIFIEVFYIKNKKNLIQFKAIALVNNINICHATILFYKKVNIQ
ncbi:3-hydroxyacyl-ACP dehydratase FabZ [Buchnera aphidicola (Aphis helianthi)]|uniref:3-hydroxyacyl-[acyl-carrier-protein] dehydratase FabZ n=1 Tax=Buchnera aphidicola (Aphis helianthi) TaxID=2315802 RepID=A0A4D6XWG5_9GAMM|nr:3-hydroxyacyl-ACP dehydratase FabZ [Buchnera aphidicola]QCI17065.1 3-hydroxyacyl-ACP dehydratase FabZ [Buchnera aphidicola (Aphis helianthi)]